MTILGGNNISQVPENNGLCSLVENEKYSFFYSKTSQKHTFELPLNSLVLLPLSKNGKIRLNGQGIPFDCILMAAAGHCLLEVEGSVELVIGGVKGEFQKKNDLIKQSEIKRVQKPWGYELWYSGESKHFAFKKLFLKADNRLSLQYHEIKKETQFLYQGQMNLHYYEKFFFHKDEINVNQIQQEVLFPKVTIDIAPMTVHRMEAISDVTIFEVSGPELDDVIRVQDDSSRQSGRIESEFL